ncbi:hypothetical protein MBANPS3_010929 [Mucor bainieri]
MLFSRRQPPQQHPEPDNNDIELNNALTDDFNFRKWSMALATDLRDVLHTSCLLTRSILRVLTRLLSGIIYLIK